MTFVVSGCLWLFTDMGGKIDVFNSVDGTTEEIDCLVRPLNRLFFEVGLLVTDGGIFYPMAHDASR